MIEVYYSEGLPMEALSWCEGLLEEARLRKIKKYKNQQAAECSLTAGVLLAYACRRHGIEGEEKFLRISSHGKPEFAHEIGWHFSISHTEDFVCVAFSDEAVGVDAEHVRPMKEGLIRKVFTKREQAWIREQESTNQAAIRLWTRKESLGKLTGEGLSERIFSMDLLDEDRMCSFHEAFCDQICISTCSYRQKNIKIEKVLLDKKAFYK